MPEFTGTVPDLVDSGPTMQISIGASRELMVVLDSIGGTRAPVPVMALIDTGAHATVLNPETVARLGIRPVGTTTITTPSTTEALQCNRYHINVYFPDDIVVENIFAVEAPMGGVPFQCLIGRDILRLATLTYRGRENRFTLELPRTGQKPSPDQS